MSQETFSRWFKTAMRLAERPFPYQERLATETHFPRFLNVPTGCGKTAAVILAWLWRRRFHPDRAVRTATPRRLVYCLPMRVLVEQTRDQAIQWLRSLDLSTGTVTDENGQRAYVPEWDGHAKIPVFTLMGGERKAEWEAFPEREAILIGTQDMLLSRALNRGYAAKPTRWPLNFGLLNLDTLWIMDEVQLMGVGRTSSVQLQHYFDNDEADHRLRFPRCTLWMSATLGAQAGEEATPAWMVTPERKSCPAERIAGSGKDDLAREEFKKRWKAPKRLEDQSRWTAEHDGIELRIMAEASGDRSRMVLVFLNRVSRAKALYERLRECAGDQGLDVLLIHGRFRPVDRRAIEQRLRSQVPPRGRIVVTTQVLEAGVDLDADALFTEVCPWPSLVQRLGRLNRRGEKPSYREVEENRKEPAPAVVFEVPVPVQKDGESRKDYEKRRDREGSLPYEPEALQETRSKLQAEGPEADLSPEALSSIASKLVVEGPVLRRFDLDDLFDTDPDLAGGHTDVSAFVRALDRDVDVYLAWRRIKSGRPIEEQPPLHPEELCPVPFYEAKEAFKKHPTYVLTLATKRRRGAAWRRSRADEIQPGDTVMLDLGVGCYSSDLGWLGSTHPGRQPACWVDRWDRSGKSLRAWARQSEDGAIDFDVIDDRVEGARAAAEDPHRFTKEWMELGAHISKAVTEGRGLVSALGTSITDALIGAAVVDALRWHDVGKALERQSGGTMAQPFQEMLRSAGKPENGHPRDGILYAKSNRSGGKPSGFRHEVASTLAYLASTEPEDLVAYLILSHHGKVRMLPLSWGEAGVDACGVRPGDQVPASAVPGENPKAVVLAPSAFRSSREHHGWQGRVQQLLRDYGPFTLAYLEALMQIADWRAS